MTTYEPLKRLIFLVFIHEIMKNSFRAKKREKNENIQRCVVLLASFF